MKPQNTLTRDELVQLSKLEGLIESGRRTWIAAGEALVEIRNSRLYRQNYSTFEDYCQAKWNFTRQYANQLIGGAGVVKSLPTGMKTIVSNQGQARELSKVDAAQREQVLTEATELAAIEDKPLAARHIKEAAAELVEPEPTEPTRKQTTLDGVAANYPAATIEELLDWAIDEGTPEQCVACLHVCEAKQKALRRKALL